MAIKGLEGNPHDILKAKKIATIVDLAPQIKHKILS